MITLSSRQKQLIFDYCIGLTSETETAEVTQLLSSNEQAADLHAKLKAALSPLDSLEAEPCPDQLVEGTIWRLNNLARSSQLRLEQLLAQEQAKGARAKSRFWRNLGEMTAVAAAIVFVAGVLIAPLNFARQRSWQQLCQMQLQRVGQGIQNYSADYDGQLPAVATVTGAPWWKVGYQGNENHSNTRPAWLLVKGDYVDAADFVCPGRSQGRVTQFDAAQAKHYNDFPARRYMTYSFRIRCRRTGGKEMLGRKALVSDMNPLFERLPQNYAEPLVLRLTKELTNANSINHKRRGQNVLFCDGSYSFVKRRGVGIDQDDIFTLRDIRIYQGVEVPSCETDAFLAP
jgi:hypothetical protein